MKKNKKGAASFYIVAFSTLILVIIAMSFTAVVVSELTRTSNDDLSQSAYDSALAGIEDAKLAFYNYQNCLEKNASLTEAKPNSDANVTCAEILYHMNHPSCNMVNGILHGGSEEVVSVEESNVVGNNMQQYYTCVKIDDTLNDVTGSFSSDNIQKVIVPKFDGHSANEIDQIRISWFSDRNMSENELKFTNYYGGKVTYKGIGEDNYSAPPTIYVAMVQTGGIFGIGDFDTTVDDKTNRGMIYLTPVNSKTRAEIGETSNFKGAYDGSRNYIGTGGFLSSNRKKSMNLPYGVYCEEGGEYACSVTIKLPKPIGDTRNDETFRIIVGMPYGAPNDTEFSLEFLCASGKTCNTEVGHAASDNSVATLKGVQIEVDSTGKANDLFRRVKVRLENSDQSLSIVGPLELLGNGDDNLVKGKVGSGASGTDNAVTCEWNFYGEGYSLCEE